ncbi:hypothetical protein I3842_08G041500 [Carya illinoinensis]|uniref:Uncharacterized protein n=1 Tax=Carya illinoinensis TaxID=32201 RepID=A0A922E943_CARIL|nr:hypothetical protein I3842_08G041500 [Carya illinoinensis]
MERKRELCGVQKRNPIKRSRKKLLKKLVDYLISDSYMFAPLISSPPKMFRSSPPLVREPIRETKKKKLFKKIGEYLKSDSYMYAPLLQSTSPLPTGSSLYVKSVTMAVSMRGKCPCMVDNEPRDQSSNVVAKDQSSQSFVHESDETSILEEQTFGHRETATKHMVNQKLPHNISFRSLFCL